MNAACKLALEKPIAAENSRRDELIREHMTLVTAIAAGVQKSLPVHVDFDDLAHAGLTGLFDAAVKYRDDKDVAFATYAQYRIRGAILDSLRRMDCASRDVRKRCKQVEAATHEFTAKFQRKPSEAELATAMGVDCRQLREWMVDFRMLGWANTQGRTREDGERPAAEIPAAPMQHPDQIFARRQMTRRLRDAMGSLPKRYQRVLELYYEGDLTMREIGGLLGVNESRISQIHKAALRRMQQILGETGIVSISAFC